MHNGSRVQAAWAWLRTVHSSRWFEGLRPPAPAAAVLTSGQAGLTKSDLSHQSSEASLSPLSCRVQTSQHPGPGLIRIPSEDISGPDNCLPLIQRGSSEREPNLDLLNVPVIQNSFIMKVSKKTFPPDIVIPCSSGFKTKH